MGGHPPRAEWLQEIRSAIEGADNFIFVLSPDSVASDICRQELDHAVSHNKRLVPIVCREVDPASVHASLAKLHWVFFAEPDAFDSSVRTLLDTLGTDLDWVRAHTRLLTKSIEWDAGNHDKSLLLRGSDLKNAEAWLTRGTEKKPPPTGLQTRYILSSQKGNARRQKMIIGSVTTGLVVALVLAAIAVYYAIVSEKNRRTALSRQLSAQALQINQQPDEHVGFYDRALLLALQAGIVDDTFQSRDALFRVLQSNQESRPYIRNAIGAFPHRVADLAFSPDGRWIATACWDRNIRLWDRVRGAKGKVFPGFGKGHVHAVAFSPDSRLVASGHDYGMVRLWPVDGARAPGKPLSGHVKSAGTLGLGQVRGIAFSKDGQRLASAGEDQTVRIWDVATGDPVGPSLIGHSGPVKDVAFDPHGKWLASLGQDGSVWLWDTSLDIPSGRPLPMDGGPAQGLAFSGDGKTLARLIGNNGNDRLRLWDIAAWKPVAERILLSGVGIGASAGKTIAMSPDGHWLADVVTLGELQNRQALRLWDVPGRRPRERLAIPGRNVQVPALAFSPDGGLLAVAAVGAGDKGSGWLWDLNPHMPMVRKLFGHHGGASAGVLTVAFSPDSRRLASAGFDGTVRLWDPQTGAPAGEPLQVSGNWALAVAFSPCGKWMITGAEDRTVKLWNRNGAKAAATLLGRHQAWVTSVSFSPDASLAASAGEDSVIRVWDVAAGKAVGGPLQGHAGTVSALAFSPDGQRLASASQDGTVRLWDPSAGISLGEPVIAKKGPVADVAFSPDGRQMAIAFQNAAQKQGEVWIWDLDTRKFLEKPLEGHAYSTHSVAYSHDGRLLASAGGDDTIRIWDVATRQPLGAPLHGGRIFVDVAFSPDGRWLAAANQDAAVWLWDMNWRFRACRIADRDLTLDEWHRYLGPEEAHRPTCKAMAMDAGQNR